MIILMFLGYIDPGTGYTIFGLGAWVISLVAGLAGLCLVFFKKIFIFFKKRRKGPLIVLAALLGLAVTVGGILMTKKEPARAKKIIILGFDGLSPDIVETMMDAGELPNFQRLKTIGSYSRLKTTNPPQSPVAWAAFATGVNPGRNGVFDFIIRNPATYQLDLSLSQIKNNRAVKVVKSKEFWRYTSEAKIPTVILNAPLTFPPDKVYGRMLSGMGVPDILGTEGTFTFYTSEPQEKNKDIGGKVFHIQKANTMTLYLIGPRTSFSFDKGENIRVPFKVSLKKKAVVISCQGGKTEIKEEAWSGWQEVSFDITPFKKMKGIFKFYLVATEPEFKLYISPIQFDPRQPFFPISYPKNYSKELAKTLGLFYTQGMPVDTWAVNEGRLSEARLIEQCEEVLKEKKAMLDLEMSRFKRGILFCYFGTSDTIQHMFWRHTDPRHPLYDPQAPQIYKNMIKTWYKKCDAILGEVMNKIDTDKDTLVVLSDHGFNSFRRAAHVNAWLRDNGYLQLKSPEIKEGAALLEDVDWSKTKAYAIGFGSIYINQKGREKSGIVEQGKETDRLKEELSQKLKNWKDEKYNEPVVHNVYKNEDIFWGRYAKDAPDLFIGFNIGYRASWQTALGAVPSVLLEDNLKIWSGDHLFDPDLVPGVLFSNKKITKRSASLFDIAPTVLKELHLKGPKDGLDGESLF